MVSLIKVFKGSLGKRTFEESLASALYVKCYKLEKVESSNDDLVFVVYKERSFGENIFFNKEGIYNINKFSNPVIYIKVMDNKIGMQNSITHAKLSYRFDLGYINNMCNFYNIEKTAGYRNSFEEYLHKEVLKLASMIISLAE